MLFGIDDIVDKFFIKALFVLCVNRLAGGLKFSLIRIGDYHTLLLKKSNLLFIHLLDQAALVEGHFFCCIYKDSAGLCIKALQSDSADQEQRR